MNELLLKYAWKHKRLATELYTSDGEAIRIIKSGRENFDAGPDFFMAELCIGNTTWAGNVEIHIKSSDWNKHHHYQNEAYNNVILHVVYEHDCEIEIKGKPLPTLVLSKYIEIGLVAKYKHISQAFKYIPCEKQHQEVDPFYKSAWFDRLLIDRLAHKATQAVHFHQYNKGDYQETFYQLLLKGFGRQVNKDVFLQLSRNLPYKLIQKYYHAPDKIAALLYGVAGFLNEDGIDTYYLDLCKTFNYLKHKYKLNELRASQWKFLRMRPVNFPTIKLAQLAHFLQHNKDFSSFYLEPYKHAHFDSCFDFNIHPFWANHYTFKKQTSKVNTQVGDDFKRHLLINVMLPFKFFYQRELGEEEFSEIMQTLRQLKPESNRIVNNMKAVGFENPDAASSQSLIQLYSYYCEPKKCLNCHIGHQILRAN